MTTPTHAAIARVGFVGLGRMGGAMFGCVVEAGFPCAAFDVRSEAARPFADRGDVVAAGSPAELASSCDVVDVVVNTDQQVLDACLGDEGLLEGARAGTVVLIHSTISLDTLRAVATAAAPVGVQVLDAPVSGRWGHRSAGDLCVMVGGDSHAFQRARPVLDAFGGLVLYLGALGSGLDTKLALNLTRYLTMMATREAMDLLAAAGVEAPFVEILEYTGALEIPGHPRNGPPPNPRIPLDDRDAVRLENNAATARKDLRAAVARGAELGVDLVTAAHTIQTIHGFWGSAVPADPAVD